MYGAGSDESVLTQVVYDRKTGRILARSGSYDVASESYVELPAADILEPFRDDDAVLAKLTDGDESNLAVLTTPMLRNARTAAHRVSRGRLVPSPQLRLQTDREVLEGDGKDAATLTVTVVDDRGRAVRDFDGEIHLLTSRGKLSARGGRVQVEGGEAEVTLTSVPETVEQVQVRARAADGSASPTEVFLRFE